MFWIKYLLFVAALHLTENKVLGLPYASDERCPDPATYYNKALTLCCRSCAPGFRQTSMCTATSDTVCEACDPGYYSENWNHYPNCFRCKKCRSDRGLEYDQHCSASSDVRCVCKKGTYCPSTLSPCPECREFTVCDAGHGVSEPGTAESDVKCSPCPEGTFSAKVSNTETCQRHTDCGSQGRDTVRRGSPTSNALCGEVVRPSFTGTPANTATTLLNAKTQTIARIFTTSNPHMGATGLLSKNNNKPDSWGILIGAIIAAIVLAVAFIAIAAFALCRKREGNINNKQAIKPLHGSSGVGQVGSFTACPTEQQYHNVPVAPEPTVHSSHGPVHHSSQEGNVCQDSPQTSSPTVTVNINTTNTTIRCHLQTGTCACAVPPSPATDVAPPVRDHDRDLPLSKEEERLDLPQHCEAKDAHTAVQESGKVVC
ncbi:hypothetical protein AAFF_G00125400 [Aldrovandia affinis]|uniref:TNFR-Cys domain-containing protein n=1 Tax=Aldrovandia affinis TaxID=143900 RepID=A0AAD7WAL7_9TELE|nr:hypothetical protein AAFF_G00125400 [Aldrovandia affinis]